MPDAEALLTRRAALQRAAFLLGGALAAPTIAGVLAGCGRDAGTAGAAAGAAGAAAYQLRALTPEQDRMVAAVAEHIIPATTTPGAGDARVHEFVDRMLAEYYPAATRERVAAGLARLDARARRRHGRAFADCTGAQQFALVDALDAQAFGPPAAGAAGGGATLGGGGSENTGPAAARRRDPAADNPGDAAGQAYAATNGAPSRAAPSRAAPGAGPADADDPADAGPQAFFRTLKELTVVGYYTSELGATRELRPNPMGRYRADVPYREIGTTWA